MPGVLRNDNGQIAIDNDIIGTIAGFATVENYGIVGMASKNTGDGFWELLGRENLRKGVLVKTEGTNTEIDLYVMVEYGVSINTVAENVIHNVGYRVHEYTGLNVTSVNVHVEGVRVNQV